MMKMPLVYLLNIYIYIFLQNKKWTKKLTSLQGFKKEKEKAIEQTGTTVLASYIYVHDKFIHLNFFKTHSTKWKKKHWPKKKKKQKKKNIPTHSTIPSISIQWCSVGDRRWRGPQKQTYNTLEGRLGVYLPWKFFLPSFSTGRTFMKCDFNLWKGYCTYWRMKTVPGTKQLTVPSCGPRVYKHARSHMTHTLFPHSPSQWVCLYVFIYIYIW